jgi:transcriptional regulator with XRE-family HTH domain
MWAEVILMIRTAIIIRAIRRQMGWTRKDMARVMGVSVACVGRIERGEQGVGKDAAERLRAATGAKLIRIL